MNRTDVTNKLIMTLLVKNEIDIVRQNIEFHLAGGVDHVIAIDNASHDGTRDILLEFEKLGVATVIDEPGQDYAQAKWVTRAALMARDEFGAGWIINNDADEFWWCADGRLKVHLANQRADKLVCRRRNMVYAHDEETTRPWHERLVYRVDKPLPKPRLADNYLAPLPAPFFYLNLPPKVLVRAAGLKFVHQGNHDADFESEAVVCQSEIEIYHFPVRSSEGFRQQVMQGAEACKRNREFTKGTGWHWRRWQRKIFDEGLASAIGDALPSGSRLAKELKEGAVVEDRTMCDLLS